MCRRSSKLDAMLARSEDDRNSAMHSFTLNNFCVYDY